jgi:hypothetical protein
VVAASRYASVVAEVRRPPWLRIRHQLAQILPEGVEVEGRERLRVIELLPQRIGLGGVVVQDLQVELVGPPVAVTPAPQLRVCTTGHCALSSVTATSFRLLSIVLPHGAETLLESLKGLDNQLSGIDR